MPHLLHCYASQSQLLDMIEQNYLPWKKQSNFFTYLLAQESQHHLQLSRTDTREYEIFIST